jgi:Protein of unknown function (DUF4242)
VITFMAECFWPGVTEQKVADAGERVRQAAGALAAQGRSSRYVGSILVPSDEIALCLFEAPSEAAAAELGEQAAIPFERILRIVQLT